MTKIMTWEEFGIHWDKVLSAFKRTGAEFFQIIGGFWHRMAMMTFRMEGARAGHPRWPDFSAQTLMTFPAMTWKIRYGTDMKGMDKNALTELKKKWGWGHRGYMRPGVRRYGPNSKLLQASGSFMRSFRIMNINSEGVSYGTAYERAMEIMAGKDKPRPVLFVTEQDTKFIARQFVEFARRNLING